MTLNALIVACGWEPALVPDPEVECRARMCRTC